MVDVGRLAARHQRRFVNHTFKTGVSIAASLHVLAAVPNTQVLEYAMTESPIRHELTYEELRARRRLGRPIRRTRPRRDDQRGDARAVWGGLAYRLNWPCPLQPGGVPPRRAAPGERQRREPRRCLGRRTRRITLARTPAAQGRQHRSGELAAGPPECSRSADCPRGSARPDWAADRVPAERSPSIDCP